MSKLDITTPIIDRLEAALADAPGQSQGVLVYKTDVEGIISAYRDLRFALDNAGLTFDNCARCGNEVAFTPGDPAPRCATCRGGDDAQPS